jgi:hypothetical protein
MLLEKEAIVRNGNSPANFTPTSIAGICAMNASKKRLIRWPFKAD